jgi:predicted transport protein
MSAGYVYILYNPSLQTNYFKIGLTTKTPEKRARELSSATGVVKPFEVAYSVYIVDCAACEQLVHQKLTQFHAGKEFFELPLEDARLAVDEASGRVGVANPPQLSVAVEQQFREVDFSIPRATKSPVPFEEHLPKTDVLGKEILLRIRKEVLALGSDVTEKATTYNRIAYSKGRVFLEVKVHKNRIRVLFLDIPFEDPRTLVQEIPRSYGWGRLKFLANLRSLDDLAYAMPYIRASYKHTSKIGS